MELSLFDEVTISIANEGRKYFYMTYGTGEDVIGYMEESDLPYAKRVPEEGIEERLVRQRITPEEAERVVEEARRTGKWTVYKKYELIY